MLSIRWKALARRMYEARYIYVMLLPGMLFFLVFSYGPMYGLLLAFKKFNARFGILFSPWIGMTNFERLFITTAFSKAMVNTVVISFSRLLIEFPFPIFLAVMINEMRGKKLKRVYQTIYTFPHFLSWIIVASVMRSFLSNAGAVNNIIDAFGGRRIDFLANQSTFRGLLYSTSIWKGAGWSSIIYLAAIAGINPELYEAATVDGAGRLRQIWHITLPGIRSTILVLFILAIGGVMNAGFDQIFNMYNSVVLPVADIIDTYVYRITFQATPDYGFSTAVGMFKSIINFVLLIAANGVSKLISGDGLFR